MMTESFLTLCEAAVEIKLPNLDVTTRIFSPFLVTSQISNYDAKIY